MKRKPLILALLSVVMIVSIAYATILFTHTTDNGQSLMTEYNLVNGTIYYIDQHGAQYGKTHVKVVTMDDQLIWQSDMIYNQTKYFSVSTSGTYKCYTTNTSTVPDQHVHSDWKH